MTDLIKLTLKWSLDRNINKYGSSAMQALKFVEEALEYTEAVCKAEEDDAIGDMVVCLINGISTRYRNLTESDLEGVAYTINKAIMDSSYIPDFDSLPGNLLLKQLVSDFVRNRIKEEDLIKCLILKIGGARVKECLELAYNVIKNRKGFLTPDGCFVKQEDAQ